uniref:Potentail helicase MOV-10 n=2 Tax=Coccidioides posadasii TaxID=199306 RepID=A0A0J6FNM5_COCPO|nr:potentail helicase MOV-10 [Coccidioides posadasii RMSCC 3488]
MSALKPFKIPPRKAAIRIINPANGEEIDVPTDQPGIRTAESTIPPRTELPRGQTKRLQNGDHAHENREPPSAAESGAGEQASLDTAADEGLTASSRENDTDTFVQGGQRSPQTTTPKQSAAVPRSCRTGWKPDINTPPYIPSYLWAIQQSPVMNRFSKQLDSIDFGTYIQSFAGTRYLKPVPETHPEISKVRVTLSRHPRNLAVDNYFEYFSECLKLEAFAHSATLSRLTLFNTTLELSDRHQHLYALRVPGLRDNTPSLDIGDAVAVRQFFPFPHIAQQGLEWLSENENGLNGSISPGFNGIQIYSYVWGVSRATETVILRVDGFFPSSSCCNASFTLPVDLYTALWRAIRRVSGAAPSTTTAIPGDPTANLHDERSWVRHMLFPKETDCVTQKNLPKGSFDREWCDSQLNYEQQKAVDSVVSRDYGNVPFLISGVPGSGKTKTVVECALQLLSCTVDVTPHLLICAPSNPAADTLAIRLSAHLNPSQLFRMNGWNRTFAEVPDQVLPYSYTEKEVFSLPDFQTMMKYKIVVTTCKDADMLVRARLTNQDLMNLAHETISTIAPSAQVKMEKLIHWTALIVDEAAQATEPTVCVPLTVVSTAMPLDPKITTKTSLPLFIMAGDEHQLGPRIYNSDTALSVSLFERLFARPIYSNHPLSRRNIGPYKKLTRSMLPMRRPAFVNLTRNYRSHPAILAMSSVLFYNDTLIPSAERTDPLGPVPTWPDWPSRYCWPILFNCNTSQDQVEDVLTHGPGTGVYNDTEAEIALRYVRSLLSHSSTIDYTSQDSNPPPRPISQPEIAIITPFLAQVTRLRELFRAHHLYDVSIGPLEAFQGLETRFLIICTTRTRSDQKFLDIDQSRDLGLVGARRRFNMAITRAKEGVIIIGNPNVLVGTGKDETWRAFLSFCARNGCWAVEKNADQSTKSTSEYWFKTLGGTDGDGHGFHTDFDITDVGYVSRLERGLLHADLLARMEEGNDGEVNGSLTKDVKARRRELGVIQGDEDAAMWTAGLAAEEALRGSLDDEYTA